MGFPRSSSAKMHPADHVSTAGPYACVPRSSSGGRYQSVMTLLVSAREFSSAHERASPKSASFSTPLLSMSRFAPLMSRCRMLFRWQ